MVNQEKFVKAKRFTTDFTLDDVANQVLVKLATTIIAGKVRLATVAEAGAGTSQSIAVTPAGLSAAIAGLGGGGGGPTLTGVDMFDSYTRNLIVTMSDNSTVALDMTDLISYIAGQDRYVASYYGWDFYTNALILQYTNGSQLTIPMTDVINRTLDLIPNADEYQSGKVQLAQANASASMDMDDIYKAVTPAGLYAVLQNMAANASAIQPLNVSSTNVDIDMFVKRNFSMTLTGNRVLRNPQGVMIGRSGSIFINQDSTGSRLLSYGNAYQSAGGISTLPQLSTEPNAVDRLDYIVRAEDNIQISLTKNLLG